ncbi:hypothetical protein GCM10027346_07820 [Hymenobacter seoulensis]
MKQFLPLVLGLCGLAACQHSPSAPNAEPAAPELVQQQQPAVVPAKQEFVEDAMLTVNGKPHQELSTTLLQKQLGRPDSIAKGAIECGGVLESLSQPDSPNGDWWYYGKSMYEVDGSQAILHSFDVTTGKFQGKIGGLVLNQHTTLEDVRRIYPAAVKAAGAPSTVTQEQTMSLPFFYEGTPTDASLSLKFKEGRLQEVEFFFPC